MGGSESLSGERADRGVAPMVAVAILIGLVVASALAVFVVASDAMFSVQDRSEVERGTNAMVELSHQVQSGGDPVAALPDEGTTYVDADEGRMRVSVRDENGSDVASTGWTELGTLYYTTGDTRLAYQGGGVWRRDAGQNSTMVSAPPLEYHNRTNRPATLSVPMYSLDESDGSYDDGRLQVVDQGQALEDVESPLADNETVVLEVESEFYLSWADYFEDRFVDDEADSPVVERDHAARTARVTLQADGADADADDGDENDGGDEEDDVPEWNDQNPYERIEVEGIPGFLMNDGQLLHPRQGLEIDSYDSDDGPYRTSSGENGSIISDGDVDLSNEATIRGDVVATGEGTFSNDVEVTGATILGAESGTTLVDSSGGTTFHGVFSTKADLEVSGGVTFRDHVIVGGDLETFDGEVQGSLFVHGGVRPDGEETLEGEIEGDLVIVGDGDVDLSRSDLEVGGDVYTGVDEDDAPAPLAAEVSAIDRGVDIDQKRDEFQSSNDNCRASAVSYRTGPYQPDPCYDPYGDPYDSPYDDSPDEPAQLDCGGYYSDTCRLEAGDYYLEDLSLSGYRGSTEKLVLDTSDGPINIFVEGGSEGAVDVNRGGWMDVKDGNTGNPVTVYSADDFRVREGGEITVPGQRTPLFRAYMHPEATWRVSGGSTFMGAVFGLSDGTTRTTVDLSGGSGSSIYGAMLGDIDEFDQSGAVHYDEALAEIERPEPCVGEDDECGSEEEDDGRDGGGGGGGGDEDGGDGGGGDDSPDLSSAEIAYLSVEHTTVEP